METTTCPHCNCGQLFFSADGRYRECEQCGCRLAVAVSRPSAQALIDELAFRHANGGRSQPYTFGQAGVRTLLAQGIGAVQAGDLDEAHHCLTRVLYTDAGEADKVRAWLWLSQVFTEAAEKRLCLEQVLLLDPAHGTARRGLALLDGRLKPQEIIDPDQIEQEIGTEPRDTQAEQFTCPRCAGHMNYTPDGRALLCEFCHYRQVLAEEGKFRPQSRFGQGAFEQEFTIAMATSKGHMQPVQMRAFVCQSCAVSFVLAPETISLTCPYCSAVYVTETAETQGIIPPHALVPFAITRDQATRVLRAWFKQHKLERPRLSPVTGVYLPAWTFDIGGEIKWSGLVKKGEEMEPVNGNYLPFYDDLLVPADTQLASSVSRGFTEFDLSGLVAYDARFLANWPAERYQVSLADASLTARKKALKDLRRALQRTSGGDYVSQLRLQSTGLIIESYKHILLPMWLVHYQLEGQVYEAAINGQNGNIHGERPQGAVGRFFARLLGG